MEKAAHPTSPYEISFHLTQEHDPFCPYTHPLAPTDPNIYLLLAALSTRKRHDWFSVASFHSLSLKTNVPEAVTLILKQWTETFRDTATFTRSITFYTASF